MSSFPHETSGRSLADHRYNTSAKGKARQARYRDTHREQRRASQRDYWFRVGYSRRRRRDLESNRARWTEQLLIVHEEFEALARELGLPEDYFLRPREDEHPSRVRETENLTIVERFKTRARERALRESDSLRLGESGQRA